MNDLTLESLAKRVRKSARLASRELAGVMEPRGGRIAAGNATPARIDENNFNPISYGIGKAGGGNCTRGPNDATDFQKRICVKGCMALSDGCREGKELHELVANWRRLTPDARAAIMQLVRGRS
jgi:predicted Fe-S protein YdhL (DUF1289 family)